MTGESIGYGLSKLMEMLGLKSVLGNMDLTALLGSLPGMMTTIGKVSGLIGNMLKLSIGVVTDRRLIESTMSLISEVIPLLRENIPRFIPLISMMMPMMIPTAIGAMPALLNFILKKMGEVMDAGIGGLLNSLPSLIQATISATAAVLPMLTSILSDILKNETLRESIVSLLSGVINLLRGLLEGLMPTLEIFNLA